MTASFKDRFIYANPKYSSAELSGLLNVKIEEVLACFANHISAYHEQPLLPLYFSVRNFIT